MLWKQLLLRVPQAILARQFAESFLKSYGHEVRGFDGEGFIVSDMGDSDMGFEPFEIYGEIYLDED